MEILIFFRQRALRVRNWKGDSIGWVCVWEKLRKNWFWNDDGDDVLQFASRVYDKVDIYIYIYNEEKEKGIEPLKMAFTCFVLFLFYFIIKGGVTL
jgi:hypothetical protein